MFTSNIGVKKKRDFNRGVVVGYQTPDISWAQGWVGDLSPKLWSIFKRGTFCVLTDGLRISLSQFSTLGWVNTGQPTAFERAFEKESLLKSGSDQVCIGWRCNKTKHTSGRDLFSCGQADRLRRKGRAFFIYVNGSQCIIHLQDAFIYP